MTELIPWQQAQWRSVNIARQHERLPHALLMAGPAGLGKLEFARLLANSLVCEHPDDHNMPCGNCRQCKLVQAGNHPDLREVCPEESSKAIKIDPIRMLVSQSILSVAETRYRVFIVDPAESMTKGAANSLLKTLEEPVQRTLLILVTANPGRLPPTIRSRCQHVSFSIPERQQALDWLTEKNGLDPSRASDLLHLAKGGPLLARQMAEGDELQHYQQRLGAFLGLAGKQANPVAVAAEWHKQHELKVLLDYMKRWLMDIIRFANGAKLFDNQASTPVGDLKTLANRLDLAAVYKLLDSLFATERRMTNNINPQLALEQLLLHWVYINRKGVK